MNEGILNKIGRFFITKSPDIPSHTSWEGWLQLIYATMQSGEVKWNEKSKLLDLYFHSVHDAIQSIAGPVSNLELQLFREKKNNGMRSKTIDKDYREWLDSFPHIRRIAKAIEIEEVISSPALRLFDEIDAGMTIGNAMTMITTHIELTGDHYWHLTPNEKTQKPAYIRVIMPNVIKDIELDDMGKPTLYVTNKKDDKGNEIKYPAKEIIHFWDMGPWSTKLGCGNTYSCSGWANVQRAVVGMMNTTMENIGIPPMFVNLKNAQMNPTQFETFKKGWSDLYNQIKSRGKTAFGQGEIEITKLGWSPDELQIETTWQLAKKSIANAHGVPVSKLDDVSNRAVADRQDMQFMRDTVAPRVMNRIASELTQSLLPLFENTEGYFFAVKNIVPEDETMALNKRRVNMQYGITSVNEAREEQNIDPSINPYADELMADGNRMPLGTARPNPTAQMMIDEIMERKKELLSDADQNIKNITQRMLSK